MNLHKTAGARKPHDVGHSLWGLHCACPIIWKALVKDAVFETDDAATTLATLALTAVTTAIVIVLALM
jgi:hypothetical protein